MKLGIIKCDQVSEVFVAQHGQYADMFAHLLLPIDPNLEFVIYDAELGQLPTDIDQVDAYLISGSRHGVNDGFAWIDQLEEFVLGLYQAQKKVIGICFGHQIIAKALGGKVIKSPKGWGVGVSQNQIVAPKEWMHPSKDQLNILVSHQDQVVELPKEAEVLASSDFCPYYLLRIGHSFLSIQGHPEFTKPYAQDLMISREDAIGDLEFEQAMKSMALTDDSSLFAQWMVNFLRTH